MNILDYQAASQGEYICTTGDIVISTELMFNKEDLDVFVRGIVE